MIPGYRVSRAPNNSVTGIGAENVSEDLRVKEVAEAK